MARIYLFCCVAVFLGIGIALLVWPAEILAGVDVKIETTTAFSDIRADYGGCVLGISLFLGWCAMSVDRTKAGLLCCGMALSGYAAGRLYSLVVDGVPKRIIFWLLLVELAGAMGCFVLVWKTDSPNSELVRQ